MKKLTILTAALILAASPSYAEKLTETADDIQIPEQYIEIDTKCRNPDIYRYNSCLKDALFKIMDDTLTEEQVADLKSQLNNIEQEVDTAELDYDTPQAKAVEGDENKIKQFRAESMNLILKRILVETLNSLNAITSELDAS